eukprot:gene16917-18623_t
MAMKARGVSAEAQVNNMENEQGDIMESKDMSLNIADTNGSAQAEDQDNPLESPTKVENFQVNESQQHTRKRSVLKREDRPRSTAAEQKRVSFCTFPSERKVSNASDCYLFMQDGSEFLKLRPGGRQYKRLYQLDLKLRALVWKPSSKKPDKSNLPIDMIYEVRAGKSSAIFSEYGSEFKEGCCLSIVIGSSFDSIDLVARSPEDAKVWITGIRLLTRQALQNEDDASVDMRDCWLGQQYQTAVSKGKQSINEKEITALLRKLRITAPPSIIRQKFQEVLSKSTNPSKNALTKDEFVSFFKDITTRPEIYFLLVKYSSNGKYLTTDDLLIFLEAEQGMTWVGKEYCLEVINRCEPTEEGRKKQILGIDGFTRYLMDKECDVISCKQSKEVSQDMTKPMSHYFIASSHNTYLLEDQLTGKSSVQAYVRALQRGCRCVELDCWDGPNGEPIIYHGRTLTSRIGFHETLVAINEHAFEASEYPLILSLENHCCTKQQKVMAEHLINVFGEKLHVTPIKEDIQQMPSPQSLRWKILIKNKKLPASFSSDEGEVSEEEEEEAVTYSGEDRHSIDSDSKNGYLNFKSSAKSITPKQEATSVHKTMSLAKELSDLVTVCKSVRFRTFQYSLDHQKYWELCSLGETMCKKFIQSAPEEVISYNKRFLSRIYPAGKRVDSSNFNPQEYWNCGCQLVALNYQYPGLSLDLNRGRFLQNGKCGYVLKPAVLREEVAYYSPQIKGEIPGVCSLNLQIKVISGHQFPKPKGSTAKGDDVDPFIVLEIHGIPADTKSYKTRTIPHNGYNPVFDESFDFHVSLPELALLRFVVLDDDFIGDGFIGQFTVPVDCLNDGYRMVKLLSNTGESLFPASLFIQVTTTKSYEMSQSRLPRFSFVKSIRKGREFTSLKSLGVKSVDDTFKFSIQPLREATLLRENFQASLNSFKESCGLSPRSNLKQCIRLLSKRVTDTPSVHVTMVVSQDYPCFQIEGELPSHLQRAVNAFDQLLEESRTLIENANNLFQKLNHARRGALEWHITLPTLCTKDKFTETRLTKIKDNFSWNIRVMKGQAELLKSTTMQCQEYLRQIYEAATTVGLVKSYSYEF